MKKKPRSILIILLVSLLAITGFLTQCVHYTIEDYQEDAFSKVRSFLYDALLTDEEIDRFTLYDIEEDSIKYRFSWFQMSDTNDSIDISTTIRKQWPYRQGAGGSITNTMLRLHSQKTKKRKWVRSLSNLFDTTVVNKSNVVDHIRLLPSDTIEWTVSKQKVAEYIAKGYYTVDRNLYEPHVISLFNYVGVTQVAKFRLSELFVYFKEDNIIELGFQFGDDVWNTPTDQRLNEDRVYEIKVE